MILKKVFAGSATVLVLAGCATKSNWTNPFLDDPVAVKRQFTIDDGYCMRAASGSVPIPQARVYTEGQASYAVSGFTRSPTGQTSSFSGRAVSTPSPGAAFTQGLANGMNMGAVFNARASQQRAYDGCMTALGWASSPEEAELMRKSREREKQVKADNIQVFIDAIPELARWQASDPKRWQQAVAIDKDLLRNPAFSHLTTHERLLEVAKRVSAMSP
jgi:hypothetical protein